MVEAGSVCWLAGPALPLFVAALDIHDLVGNKAFRWELVLWMSLLVTG